MVTLAMNYNITLFCHRFVHVHFQRYKARVFYFVSDMNDTFCVQYLIKLYINLLPVLTVVLMLVYLEVEFGE